MILLSSQYYKSSNLLQLSIISLVQYNLQHLGAVNNKVIRFSVLTRKKSNKNLKKNREAKQRNTEKKKHQKKRTILWGNIDTDKCLYNSKIVATLMSYNWETCMRNINQGIL